MSEPVLSETLRTQIAALGAGISLHPSALELREFAERIARLAIAEAQHDARLLAKSLTDEMIASLRAEFGQANADTLAHWKAAVLEQC